MAISNVIIKAEKKNITIDVQYDERLELNHDKNGQQKQFPIF